MSKVRLWGRPHSFKDWVFQCVVCSLIALPIAALTSDQLGFWFVLLAAVSVSSLVGMLIRGDHSRSKESDGRP